MKISKTIAAWFGCVGFFASGVVIALQARHYQVLGQPMPNGKGGFMTFRDGYYIAITLVMMSFIWFLMACRFNLHRQMTIFELFPWFIAIGITVLSAEFLSKSYGVPALFSWLIALILGIVCWTSYWLVLKTLASRLHQRMPKKEKRTYQELDAFKNYPISKDLYYECLVCGNVVTSKPRKNASCKCRNILVDASPCRIEIRDRAKVKIFSLLPT